ncbi:hypothetical protein [Aquimarina latercula]|uniref:hypothetical protein n=1 Tax=Aquimarina latercula TaxID=987 RepID=UPI000485D700|nr:hypothetical protein [Aquimarina latercula]
MKMAKKKQKERKKKNTFKPYSDVVSISDVKRRLRPSTIIRQEDIFYDTISYRSQVFYLNTMGKLKRYSEKIGMALLLAIVVCLITWLVKNI